MSLVNPTDIFIEKSNKQTRASTSTNGGNITNHTAFPLLQAAKTHWDKRQN